MIDVRKKKIELLKKHYPIAGLLVITGLGGFGFFMCHYLGLFRVKNYAELYKIMYKSGMEILIGLFFLIICLYIWISFILFIFSRPKKEIMYLCKNPNYDSFFFINKKGKKFKYYENDRLENNYYVVLRLFSFIFEVLEEADNYSNTWDPKEKKSYWLNLYTPFGDIEDAVLLPIPYLILIASILSYLMAEGDAKIWGLIVGAFPLYIIVYDFIHKYFTKE